MVMQWPFVWMSGSAEPGHINMCLVARIARKDRCFFFCSASAPHDSREPGRQETDFVFVTREPGRGRKIACHGTGPNRETTNQT